MIVRWKARKKLSDNAARLLGWLSVVTRCCSLALLFLAPLPLEAQGGPPLRTDDFGTLGRNNWESNRGYTMDRQPGDNYYETPILDMNYGWDDWIQFKYEMPYVYNNTGNGPLLSGPGDSKVGVKIRFLQNEKLSLDIGTYPQLEVSRPE